ncbi:aspartate aminotransferase family protein [Geminicoccus roseus]|uniref:aspartate aminotransferase family protein n=1 Tax=Geminicoccus roseus TaxID=404900 RepID=UPI0004894E4E|nr:aspartate aminotransferase family protein [Geminicoccus roseus]
MPQSQQILALNAFDASRAGRLDDATARLVERRQKTFGPTSVLFYEEPMHVVSANGVWMNTADGQRYLDVYNNVPSVGHCHPRVVEAIARQAGQLNTHTRYLYDIIHTYAERLLETFPDGLDKVTFTCTGTESNDLALRIATAATGRRGFVVTDNAYHGNSWAVTDVSPSSMPGKAPPPHVRVIRAPDVYRAPSDDLPGRFAADLQEAIDSLEADGIGFAAFLADTIFSSDGIYADPAPFLGPAVAAAHAAGGLFIADEVQPGFGRTGDAMWGFMRHGVTPDIVTMGKPMGNGFPMGGVVSRADLLEAFTKSVGYFNTFGGNPVAAAAGLAVLDVIADEGLVANAAEVGTHLRDRLRHLAGNGHPEIGDVRGAGLYVGVDFVRDPLTREPAPELATRVINGLHRKNILIGAAGRHGNVLKIRPPLVFSRQNADQLVDCLGEVLEEG